MPKTSLREYKSLFPYLRRYRRRYIWGFICLIVVDGAQVIIPRLMGRAVDLISLGRFEPRSVLFLALLMTGLMGIIALGRFLWRYFIYGASRRIEAELRQKLFEHLLSLSYDFYQKNKTGDLMARATNDLNAVRESIGMGLVALIDGTVMAAAIIIIIFAEDARTAALAVIPLPLITILILIFGVAVGRRFHRVQETYSAMSDTVQESFAGVRVIKSFVKEWWFIKRFAGANASYRAANMELVKLFGFFFPFISFLSGLTGLSVLLAGGIRVSRGLMSPGTLVALFRYLQMLIWPLMGAGFMVNMIQRGAAALGRVNEIMNVIPSIRPPLNPQKPRENYSGPLIEIKNLTFEYPGGTRALDDVSLLIPRGSITGILGPTGSGKSTLIKAMTRMIDPPPGTVFVKGLPVAGWDPEALRGLFGVTPQDSYLFSDTIRNNITYGLKDGEGGGAGEGIPFERAAGISAIDQDLSRFGSGWETPIGERGLTLSGGQKQRVAIARSLIGRAEILILDDALSAVDAETEKRITEALMEEREERRNRGLTMIIIANRVSALRYADYIITMERGRIRERGEREALLRSGGYYARIASLQRLGGEGDV
ncbi:MAG: ABC transporter ATP-binding protein/permease [Treponema sp.]|jgi:ATP-binding cassette subfamily B protein|nr:ABC transporter ATP-binding protein/permease [Treponema sp.]